MIVSTPDHWHAKMVIDAVHAGKDVYVEKPMAHKIDEGFAVIDAVRKTNRVVRSGPSAEAPSCSCKARASWIPVSSAKCTWLLRSG